jgi:hypothetical protein
MTPGKAGALPYVPVSQPSREFRLISVESHNQAKLLIRRNETSFLNEFRQNLFSLVVRPSKNYWSESLAGFLKKAFDQVQTKGNHFHSTGSGRFCTKLAALG